MNRTIPGLLAALLLTTGCSGGVSDGSRRIEAVDWDTAFVIGGDVNDTTLIRPWLLSAGPGGLFIFDYGSSAVKAFDLHGRHRWTHGRPGSGPNEFRNPIGMTIAPDGRVWLVDSGAGRIAVLDPAGIEHALLPLPETPQQLVHVGSRTLAVLFASDDQFSVHIADDASWTDHLDYPVGPIDAPPANLRVIRTASNFSEWAAAFVFTGSFVVFDGDAVRCTGDLREADALRAAPQEIGSETNVAAAAVVANDALWVLGIALDDRALRFADEYDLATCAYRRSLMFPVRARTLAVVDGTFIVGHDEPIPAVLGLRPRPQPIN